jgi:adenosine deaminase
VTTSPPSAELHLRIEGTIEADLLAALARNSFQASFIDEPARAGWLAEVDAWEATSQARF